MQRRWIVSLIVCTGVFMSSLDLFIVNIAFPAISKHFGGASLGSLSWILSAYAIVFAALLVPPGAGRTHSVVSARSCSASACSSPRAPPARSRHRSASWSLRASSRPPGVR